MLRLVAVCLLLGLAGCATVPPAVQVQRLNPVVSTAFEADGRVALRYQAQSSTANLHWSHRIAQDIVTISSPLGSTLAVLTRTASGVQLVDSQQHIHQAQDSRELTQQLLGVRLPLEYLTYWMLGQAVPDLPHQTTLDGDANLVQLQQAGWAVNYQRWQTLAGMNIPNKFIVVGEDSELRMVVTHWQIERAGVWQP
jgi:outer membrane lipoprotein LolB